MLVAERNFLNIIYTVKSTYQLKKKISSNLIQIDCNKHFVRNEWNFSINIELQNHKDLL